MRWRSSSPARSGPPLARVLFYGCLTGSSVVISPLQCVPLLGSGVASQMTAFVCTPQLHGMRGFCVPPGPYSDLIHVHACRELNSLIGMVKLTFTVVCAHQEPAARHATILQLSPPALSCICLAVHPFMTNPSKALAGGTSQVLAYTTLSASYGAGSLDLVSNKHRHC